MSNRAKMEVILISSYIDIILKMLSKHKCLSLNKLLVFSFLIKKRKYYKDNVYRLSNKKDIVLKGLSYMVGLFDEYCENIEYILSAIHLLIENKLIYISFNELNYIEIGETFIEQDTFIDLVIKESRKYSDRQFLKEVMKSV